MSYGRQQPERAFRHVRSIDPRAFRPVLRRHVRSHGVLAIGAAVSVLPASTRAMAGSRDHALKGRVVQFRVRDIHLPEPVAVLDELHGGDVLEGKVVDVSDSGTEGNVFVVIEVDGLRQPCVLAIERILRTV